MNHLVSFKEKQYSYDSMCFGCIEDSNTKRIQEAVYTFESVPYNVVITFGHIFYSDAVSQGVYTVRLNTGEIKEIVLPEGEAFLSYVISNDCLYLNTIDVTTGENYLNTVSLENYELEHVLTAPFPFLRSAYGSMYAYYDIAEDFIVGNIINKDKATLVSFENTVLNYLDDEYIYTVSPESPRSFKIYDYEGKLVYEIESSSTFKATSKISVSSGDLEVSGIIGVFEDNLVVVGNDTNQGVGYYTVNFKTDAWSRISDVTVLNNEPEE